MLRLLIATGVLVALNVLVLVVSPGRAAAPEPGAALRVGLVFDVGGRGDKSFNDLAYLGVERAGRELGIRAEYIEPGDGADRESGIRLFAARGFDLVIGVGFIFSDDIYAVANEYPKVRFACVDYAKFDAQGFVTPPPNLVAVKFREEEGRLPGRARWRRWCRRPRRSASSAAWTSRSSASSRPAIARASPRFAASAACSLDTPARAATPSRTRRRARSSRSRSSPPGRASIFHAAGTTGLGVFEAARETGRYVIGVDADQAAEAPGRVLTSMTKQEDVALYDVVKALKEGRFIGGVQAFGLKEGGVDYVYDARNEALIGAAVRARVEALRQDIIAGRIHPPTEPR